MHNYCDNNSYNNKNNNNNNGLLIAREFVQSVSVERCVFVRHSRFCLPGDFKSIGIVAVLKAANAKDFRWLFCCLTVFTYIHELCVGFYLLNFINECFKFRAKVPSRKKCGGKMTKKQAAPPVISAFIQIKNAFCGFHIPSYRRRFAVHFR